MSFAALIRKLRMAKRWSVYDLANAIGVKSPGYISKIEARGEIPSPEMAIKLAEALGANVEELVEMAKREKAEGFKRSINRKYDDAVVLYRKARRPKRR